MARSLVVVKLLASGGRLLPLDDLEGVRERQCTQLAPRNVPLAVLAAPQDLG